MEQTQEKKFVCKFCNKRYPCGKSLGGHIRTHMNNNNNNVNNCGESESDELISINKLLSNGRIIKRSVIESEADDQSAGAYVLRENPKKTKRFFSDSSGNGSLLKEMICKECGKEFPSLKALCGHMACHSEKERIFVEKQKQLVMDSQSDTETSSTPSKRRRSKRIRYNKANGVYDSINNNNSMANGSSSVSEIEQEQEEVAMSLMMLSRDSSGYCKKGLNSIGDHSSDNNSVILEAKSSSIDVRITINNGDKYLNMKKQRENNKLNSADHQSGTPDESLDSLYFRNGPSTEDFDAKDGKGLSKFKSLNTEFPNDNNNQAKRGFNKYDLRRSSAKNDYYSHDAFCNTSPKGSKYECLTCNKSFDSHRALGGHRANHTKGKEYCNDDTLAAYDGFIVPMTDNNNKVTKSSSLHGKTLSTTRGSSSGNAEKRLGSKKNKGHQCPFCFRVFKSGQALGGHKRSHFVGGGSEDRTLVIKQDSPDMPTATVIDLNLPAPVEDDAMGNVEFMAWEI